jgi:hypothetical protein
MALIDDGNGAKRADWLMSRKNSPPLIPCNRFDHFFPPCMIRTSAKDRESLAPAIAVESVCAAYFYTSAFPDIASTFTPPALDKKSQKGTFGTVVKET